MGNLVVFKINGEIDQGFGVTLEIRLEGNSLATEIIGSLPPATELFQNYEKWHSTYRRLDYLSRIQQSQQSDSSEVEIDSYFQRQKQECIHSANELKEELNKWLDSSIFRLINSQLIEELNSDDEVCFLISTDSSQLRRLPWHLWNLLELYPKGEIALSTLDTGQPPLFKSFVKEINILVIVGNCEGIDLKKNWENLPNAQITFLQEPEYQDLNDSLWEKPWDILFFAGHGKTEGRRGRIYINRTHSPDSLTTDEIKSAMKKAVENGLQLAIFNCCDALGLAGELEKFHIPQIIVMQEALPDQIAHKFLTHFLDEFSRGKHLYAAVRSARSSLEEIENEFPCASWLPIICQNPTVIPPTWNNLLAKKWEEKILLSEKNIKIEKLKTVEVYSPPFLNHQESQPKKKKESAWLGFLGVTTSALVILLLLSLIRLKLPITFLRPSPLKLVSAFREVDNVPKGSFKYGGSTTWAPIREQVDPILKHVWPEFELNYAQDPNHPPGSVTGIWMLLENRLAIAQSSRPLKTEEYKQAEQKKFKLKQVPVAIDAIAIAVNPKLNIPGLMVTQIRDIYLGKIVNWQQVGGPDLDIIPYSRSPKAGGTVQFFQENVLENQQFSSSVIFTSTTTEALRAVAENVNAIYYASASEVVRQCTIKPLPLSRDSQEFIPPYLLPFVSPDECPTHRNHLNHEAFQNGTYPITRNLYVIIKQNGQAEEKAGVAYTEMLLSEQGQKLIDEAGFVRIR